MITSVNSFKLGTYKNIISMQKSLNKWLFSVPFETMVNSPIIYLKLRIREVFAEISIELNIICIKLQNRGCIKNMQWTTYKLHTTIPYYLCEILHNSILFPRITSASIWKSLSKYTLCLNILWSSVLLDFPNII